MVTSDFRPEVEIWPFRACAMHQAIIIETVGSLWTWLWGRYHVPHNVLLVIYIFIYSFFYVIDWLSDWSDRSVIWLADRIAIYYVNYLSVFHQFVCVECLVTAMMDQFTVLRSYKSLVTLVWSIVLCLLGLPLCTQVMVGRTDRETSKDYSTRSDIVGRHCRACGAALSRLFNFTVRLHVMQRTVLQGLSVRPSVCLSVYQTRTLWQKRKKLVPKFLYHMKGHSSQFSDKKNGW